MPAQPEAPPSPDPVPPDSGTPELRLPANASELQRAREYADQAAASFGFDDDERFEFVFAVNEAVTNAIRHGTADADGTIRLRVDTEGDRLMLEVRDRGAFIAPSAEDEPMRDHGRGFALMSKLVDDVELRTEPRGTTIRLVKRRQRRLAGAGIGRA